MKRNAGKVKILIVEDEIIVAQDIAERLSMMNYEVSGIAASGESALQLLSKWPDVDLLLIDIVLKGALDGIELARMVNQKYQIPLMFLTSHDDNHLVRRAKSLNPSAYILKPFNDRQINVAIAMALDNIAKTTKGTNAMPMGKSPNRVMQIKDSLFLKKEQHFERVPLKEILFLKAESNYSTIHTLSNRFIYSVVLSKMEAHLPIESFCRVHRSYVVNIHLIDGFEGNTLFIGNNRIPVSKSNRDIVFNLFHKI